MIVVDALDGGGERCGSVCEADFHDLVHDYMARLSVVSEEHRDRGAFANDPGIDRLVSADNWELIGAECMQELESAVDRLRDAVEIE